MIFFLPFLELFSPDIDCSYFLQRWPNGLVNYVYSQAITTNIECYSLKNTHNQPNLLSNQLLTLATLIDLFSSNN